ncbi:Predicted acetyltransferase [Paenibacillus sp. PDC88]|nr:Predicted acetyltransferase [Paenibacillus sp. PDC88]
MSCIIRKIRTPDDFASIAEILGYVFAEPTTAENLADEDAKIPDTGSLWINEDGQLAGFDRCRLVAVNDKGEVVGYGISWRAPWTEAGELNHLLAVHPDYRKQGIGRALYTELENWAVLNGASKLNYEVNDNDASSIAFAEHRRFDQERHQFESVLELSKDSLKSLPSPPTSITIKPLSEMEELEAERKLYELYKVTSRDIPGISGNYFDFKEWKKWTLELPGSRPEYVLIALDGDRYVGVAQLLHQTSTESMYHEYTGVDKAYRGRGIGLALKVSAVQLAEQLKIKYLRTNNDSLNLPMLHINRDLLGYKPVPGRYKMVKVLPNENNALVNKAAKSETNVKVEVLQALMTDKTVIKNLVQFYIYDFTEFTNERINEQGTYPILSDLHKYWENHDGYNAYLIKANGEIAGFVLVKQLEDERSHKLAHFFILRKFRRAGVGKQAARAVFGSITGKWELNQLENNYPAIAFWNRVISEAAGLDLMVRYEQGKRIQRFTIR